MKLPALWYLFLAIMTTLNRQVLEARPLCELANA